jgi:hypothetical protein
MLTNKIKTYREHPLLADAEQMSVHRSDEFGVSEETTPRIEDLEEETTLFRPRLRLVSDK